MSELLYIEHHLKLCFTSDVFVSYVYIFHSNISCFYKDSREMDSKCIYSFFFRLHFSANQTKIIFMSLFVWKMLFNRSKWTTIFHNVLYSERVWCVLSVTVCFEAASSELVSSLALRLKPRGVEAFDMEGLGVRGVELTIWNK